MKSGLAVLVLLSGLLIECGSQQQQRQQETTLAKEEQEATCRLVEVSNIERTGACLMNRYGWDPAEAAAAQFRYQALRDSVARAARESADSAERAIRESIQVVQDSLYRLHVARTKAARENVCNLLNDRLNAEEHHAPAAVIRSIQAKMDKLIPMTGWPSDQLAEHCGF